MELQGKIKAKDMRDATQQKKTRRLLILAGFALAVCLIFALKSTRKQSVPELSARRIELFIEEDPADDENTNEVEVATIVLDQKTGNLSLEDLKEDRLSSTIHTALEGLNSRNTLEVESDLQNEADGRNTSSLTKTYISKTDEKYAWAVGRYLKMKYGFDYRIIE